MTEQARASQLRQALASEGRQLGCGARVDDLLEQVASGGAGERDEHQRGCAQCQAALAEFTELWSPVDHLAKQPVPVSKQLVGEVMKQIDKLTQDVWYTLQITDQGAIGVAARVVATIARDTARLVPGVRVALGRSTESRLAKLVEKATLRHRHPHAAVGVLGRTAVVDLALAVSYGLPVQQVAHEVQQRVIAELRTNIGLQTVVVNVAVDDVLLPLADRDV